MIHTLSFPLYGSYDAEVVKGECKLLFLLGCYNVGAVGITILLLDQVFELSFSEVLRPARSRIQIATHVFSGEDGYTYMNAVMKKDTRIYTSIRKNRSLQKMAVLNLGRFTFFPT